MSIIDIAAPPLFLIFGVYFMDVNPLNYLAIYTPIFLASLIFFLKIMKRYGYGLREFTYHQGIQVIASLPATFAFFEWVLGEGKDLK